MRSAVGDFRQSRFFRLGAVQQADDGGEAGVLAERLHFDGQGTFDIQCARRDGIARRACLWQVFAGEQRFVDARLAVEDLAVSRKDCARMHQHLIADTQFAQQDPLALAVSAQAQTRGGQKIDQLCGGGGRAFAGATLQITSGQQK
ncbi:hypothetical protein D3C87_1541530 [compost metagenome]